MGRSGICPGTSLTRDAGSRPGFPAPYLHVVLPTSAITMTAAMGKAAADAYGPSKAAAAVETAAAAMMATTMVAAAMGTVGGGGMDNADDKTAVASSRMDTSGTRARMRRQQDLPAGISIPFPHWHSFMPDFECKSAEAAVPARWGIYPTSRSRVPAGGPDSFSARALRYARLRTFNVA